MEWKNNQAAIDAALQDTKQNPIADEIALGITGFIERLKKQAETTGKFPPDSLLLYKPTNAFDETVIRLTLEELANVTGERISIHWLPQGEDK